MAQYTQKSVSQGPDNYWVSLEVNDGRTVCFVPKVILNQKETDIKAPTKGKYHKRV
jgi:hypothetical protein